MIKDSPSSRATYVLCDRCSVIVSDNAFDDVTWVQTPSRHFGKGAGMGRKLDFCSEECKIIFLRGRKYLERKRHHQTLNRIYSEETV